MPVFEERKLENLKNTQLFFFLALMVVFFWDILIKLINFLSCLFEDVLCLKKKKKLINPLSYFLKKKW